MPENTSPSSFTSAVRLGSPAFHNPSAGPSAHSSGLTEVTHEDASVDHQSLRDARLLELASHFAQSARFMDALVAADVSMPVIQRARAAFENAFCEAVVRNRRTGETP